MRPGRVPKDLGFSLREEASPNRRAIREGPILKFQTHDIQEAVDRLPGLACDYRQMGPAPQEIELVQHRLNDLTLSRIRISGRVEGVGTIKPGRIFGLLVTNSVAPHIYEGFPLVEGDLGLRTTSGFEGQQALQPGYEAWLLDLPRDPIASLLNDDPAEVWGEVVFCGRQMHDWTLLHSFFKALGAMSDDHRIAEHRMADGLLERLVKTLSVGELADLPKTRAARYRRYLSAREMIHVDPLIDKAQICETLGISLRSLRRLFAEFSGASLTTYSQSLRLDRARSELLSSSYERGLVSKIATRHGFWHLGRFGIYYKELFGESPTATLKRKKRYSRSYGLGEYGAERR